MILESWGFGMVNDPQGARFVPGSNLLAMNRTSSLVGNTIYNVQPNFFTRRRPKYTELGNTQDITVLNSILTRAANMSSIVYFPHGIYVIKDTLKIPRNSRIIGQAWSQIMATGPKFEDSEAPRVAVKVGNEGDVGVLEIQDLLFTVAGPTAGAVLVEWNIHESVQGSAGLWGKKIHYPLFGIFLIINHRLSFSCWRRQGLKFTSWRLSQEKRRSQQKLHCCSSYAAPDT